MHLCTPEKKDEMTGLEVPSICKIAKVKGEQAVSAKSPFVVEHEYL